MRQLGSFTRRQVLRAGGLAALGLGLAPARLARADALAPPLLTLLEESPYVYVSPLKSDGEESRCHGEVWYAWLDGEAVLIVSSEGWKARAVGRGLDRARIWVGDHGRVGGFLGSERFRGAPSFDAHAVSLHDDALLDRLLGAYERKYPAEIGSWRDRMRAGHADRSRVLLRYRPV